MNNKQREHRRIWTEKQDDQLMLIVQKHPQNKKRWNQIATQLSQRLNLQIERTSKQCRQRWLNLRNLQVQQKNPWTTENDLQLIRACKQHGHRWAKLAQQIGEGRSDNTLKNNFYSSLRKAVRWINKFIKEEQKVYQDLKKEGGKMGNEQIIEDFSRIRSFEVKNISKVFSLIDSKQQSRFDITQDLDSKQIQELNREVLQFLEQFIKDKQEELDKQMVVAMIVRVMRINKLARVKYTKQIKLSVCNNEEMEKKRQEKKKMEKKNDKIITSYLKKTNSQIIPAKRKKKQILSEIQVEYFHSKKPQTYQSESSFDESQSRMSQKQKVSSKKQIELQKKNQTSLKNSLGSSSKQKLKESFKFVDGHPMVKSGEIKVFSKQREDLSFPQFFSKIPIVSKNKQIGDNLQIPVGSGQFYFGKLSDKQENENPISQDGSQKMISKSSPFCPFQPMKYSMEFEREKKDVNLLQSENYLLAFQNPFVNRVQTQNILLQSQPLSGFFNESQNYSNMFGSQPMMMQRSCNYRESNPSSNVLYHSISYGSSQENKSQKSKKQI